MTQVSATITGSESILDMASLVFDRNHSDLNKFDLQVDTQYQSLKYRIIEMVESGSSTLEMRVKKVSVSGCLSSLDADFPSEALPPPAINSKVRILKYVLLEKAFYSL